MARVNRTSCVALERAVRAGRGSGSASKHNLLQKLARAADMAASCVEEALDKLGMKIVHDEKSDLWMVAQKLVSR